MRLILLFAIGSLVMRAAGCVVNDLWDRDIDRMVARTAGRPLASGTLRPRQALVFLAVLLLVGLAILLQLNRAGAGAGRRRRCCWSALYPLAKRVTWWPQLVMGFTFGFGAPLGYAAGAGRLDAAWAALYGAAILWDLGFDTIYAHQDREDDALVGVQLHRAAVRRAHRAVPRRLLRRHGRCCWRWPAGWPGWAAGSIRRCCCRRRCSRGRSRRSTSTIRRCACGCSAPTARRAWRSPLAMLIGLGVTRIAEDSVRCRLHTDASPPARRWCPEIALASRQRDHADLAGHRGLARRHNVDPPFWAFAWPGGQALARHVLDHPVAGRRPARAGLRGGRRHRRHRLRAWPVRLSVEAAEIDPLARRRDRG